MRPLTYVSTPVRHAKCRVAETFMRISALISAGLYRLLAYIDFDCSRTARTSPGPTICGQLRKADPVDAQPVHTGHDFGHRSTALVLVIILARIQRTRHSRCGRVHRQMLSLSHLVVIEHT